MIFQHTHDWITSTSPHTGQPKTQTSRLAAGYTFIQATMAIYGIDPTAREKARRILDTIPETASNHKVERNDDKYDDTDEDDDPDEWTVF